MPYCPECGAEIGDADRCPLCGTPSPKSSAAAAPQASELRHAGAAEEELTGTETRKIAWEVLSVAFLIAVLVLGAVNLFASRRFSWSLYPIVSLLVVWVEASAILVLRNKVVLSVTLGALSPPVFLVALGYVSGDPRWALGLAVPIAVLAEALAGALHLAIRATKQKGLNLISYVLIAAAALCVGLEVFIDLFVLGRVALVWSPICAIALLPIAAFLSYLHFRIMKSANLRRLFNL